MTRYEMARVVFEIESIQRTYVTVRVKILDHAGKDVTDNVLKGARRVQVLAQGDELRLDVNRL